MAAKKDSKQIIINAFMDHVLIHDKLPSSVYIFCKELKIDESEFYKYFASFSNLEEHIFVLFFDKSMDLITSDASFEKYNSEKSFLHCITHCLKCSQPTEAMWFGQSVITKK